MALPDYLQDSAKDFARQLTASTSVPINTGTFTGRQFVAGEDPLQTQAINLATQGLGSYQPFLQQAQTLTGYAYCCRSNTWFNTRFYVSISTRCN